MNSENQSMTIEQAKKNLDYAINLYNCIEPPFDEKIITFAEQDKTATAYRNLALQSLKGENVEGRIFTARNSALDRVYRWRAWIREYEEGKAEGKRETAVSMLADGVPIETVSKYIGLSVDEIKSLKA